MPTGHVVTQLAPPRTIASGALEVHMVPSWRDNLVWLIVDPTSRRAAAVDGPEASGVLAHCRAHDLTLTTILNTHTHPDHIGINRELAQRAALDGLRVVGPARAAAAVPGIDEPVDEGDAIDVFGVEARVMLTEGHIDGHVSYVIGGALFCGDALFAAGCGYLFDGPPAKMHRALSRFAELPGDTLVFCAHEYTEENLRFAWSVEPDNDALAERIRRVWAIRSDGACTVPSTIAEERATNPFMRWDSDDLRRHVAAQAPDRPLDRDVDVFAATRALKDSKRYRERGDDALPLNR